MDSLVPISKLHAREQHRADLNEVLRRLSERHENRLRPDKLTATKYGGSRKVIHMDGPLHFTNAIVMECRRIPDEEPPRAFSVFLTPWWKHQPGTIR